MTRVGGSKPSRVGDTAGVDVPGKSHGLGERVSMGETNRSREGKEGEGKK